MSRSSAICAEHAGPYNRAVPEPCPILDAHVHQWDPKHNARPQTPLVKLLDWRPSLMERVARIAFPQPLIDFVGRPDFVLAPYLPDDLSRDWGRHRHRVEGFVHVQPGWAARREIRLADETAWLERLEPTGTVLRAIVGQAHLEHAQLDAVLDAHREASRRFVGIRQVLAHTDAKGVANHAHAGDLMRRDDWRRGYARLGQRGLTFDAWVYHHQIDDLIEIARAEPDTAVVVDHMGSPVGIAGPHGGVGTTNAERAAIDGAWREAVQRMAEVEHMRFKVSGALMPISGYGVEARETPMSQREFVDRVGPRVSWFIDTVGIERCMFGSNFPMDKVSIDYETLVSGLDELLDAFSPGQRRAFFAGNASAFYGLSEPAAPAP